MTTEECFRKWAAAPDAMSVLECAQFKKEWKQHAHPPPLCRVCRLAEKIGRFLAAVDEKKAEQKAAGRVEPAREQKIREEAEVERVAADLVRLNETELEDEKDRVRKLLEEEEVKASTELEAARQAAERIPVYGRVYRDAQNRRELSDETLERFIKAKLTESRIPYESLIDNIPRAAPIDNNSGAAREKAIPIVNPSWKREKDSNTARLSTWTKMTTEGFYEAVGRFVERSTASDRNLIDLQLAERKPPGMMFVHSPGFWSLIDPVEKICGNAPFVTRCFGKHVRRAIKIAKETEQPDAIRKAELMLLRVIRYAGEKPELRKQLLDQWQKETQGHWKDAIKRELNEQKSLPSSVVWQINEERHRQASERSKSAANTLKLKALKKSAS